MVKNHLRNAHKVIIEVEHDAAAYEANISRTQVPKQLLHRNSLLLENFSDTLEIASRKWSREKLTLLDSEVISQVTKTIADRIKPISRGITVSSLDMTEVFYQTLFPDQQSETDLACFKSIFNNLEEELNGTLSELRKSQNRH